MIILIASVSMLIAYFVAKAVIGNVQGQTVKVKTAESISKDVVQPDSTVFNTSAINPTVEVIIGSQNATPSTTPSGQ